MIAIACGHASRWSIIAQGAVQTRRLNIGRGEFTAVRILVDAQNPGIPYVPSAVYVAASTIAVAISHN